MKTFRANYWLNEEARAVLVRADFYQHRFGGVEFFIDPIGRFIAAVPNVILVEIVNEAPGTKNEEPTP